MQSPAAQSRGIISPRPSPGEGAPSVGRLRRARAVARANPAKLGGLVVLASVLCAVLVGRLHELFAPLSRLPVGKLLLPLGLLLLVRQRDLALRLGVFRTPQGIAFGIFVAMMALSVPTSVVQGQSLQDFISFLQGPVPFVVIIACAPRSLNDLTALMKALVLAMLVIGTAMLTGIGDSYGGRLAASTTYDPNDLAHVAVATFPFAVYLLREDRRLWRLIGLAAMLMLLTIVMLCASRGGTIALAVVLVAMLLARSHLKMRWKAALIVLVAAALASAPGVFWERLSTLGNMSSDYNVGSESGRLEIWKRGVKVLARHPITGVGLGQFATADGTFKSQAGLGDKSWHTAHNAPLQVGVEIGVIGLVAFFSLFVPTILAARRARGLARRGVVDPAFVRVGDAMRLSLLGFGVGALFLSVGFSIITMTLAAIGMAYTRLLRGGVPRPPRSPRSTQRGSRQPDGVLPVTAPLSP
ncbi:MAG: O-antigen ligase family protein [Gemmatimonadaceae bacterium]